MIEPSSDPTVVRFLLEHGDYPTVERAVAALTGGLARAYDQGLADGLAVRDGPSVGHTAPATRPARIPDHLEAWWEE